MFILKLRYFITGFLILSLEGMATEKFINLAIHQGIPLWDIRRSAGRAVLKTDVDSFFDLRHLAKKTGCRLHIIRKVGLPFLWNRLLRRRGLALGLCFFIVTLYTLSSFVLFISVEGNQRLEAAYIRQLAAQAGARPGVKRSRLDQDQVAAQLIALEPNIVWVGMHLRGTRLVIEVVESIAAPVDMDNPADLVAAKDGLVMDVLLITGEARVKSGDTVARGQLLIEGVLLPQLPFTAAGEDPGPAPVAVRARGEVRARVWYEGYGEAALVENERTRTGQRFRAWIVVVDGQSVLRVGRSSSIYVDSDTEAVTMGIFERILRIPVELITETTHEVLHVERKLTVEQALDVAAQRARTLAQLQLPVGLTVVAVSVEEVELEREGFVGVRYVLETVENIAVEKEVAGGD